MDYPYRVMIELAGHKILFKLHFKEAYDLLSVYKTTTDHYDAEVFLNNEDWFLLKKHGFQFCGQVEASYLAGYCSDYLLEHQCCVIHAAAFRDKNNAWVIAAEPGVGKSTQVKTLNELYPDTFEVICGDRPVLELCDDGTVMVHPAPWNGKEGWRGGSAAPLKGIICLSRGDHNSITLLKRKDAVIPVFKSLIQTARTKEILLNSASFLTELLNRVKVYNFINEDIPDSTTLLYETILSKED